MSGGLWLSSWGAIGSWGLVGVCVVGLLVAALGLGFVLEAGVSVGEDVARNLAAADRCAGWAVRIAAAAVVVWALGRAASWLAGGGA